MPTVRKRSLQELNAGDSQAPAEPSMLHRIRNMWQFANLFQFILLFGHALKLDDSLDIEDLEAECLKPGSMALQSIGLGLLRFLSSHRGLTHELFDEYTRRQFVSKAPEKNPFGTDETPAKFAHFDVFTKIRVLQQMTQLIMMNPERLREKTEEQKDADQTNWRIEPYGWDRHDRTYFVLDDNRLYRLVEAPAPPPNPKKSTKKAKAAQRASKRRRISAEAASDVNDANDANGEASEAEPPAEPEDDGLGNMKWECIAVTLGEVRDFLSAIQKSKDPNEKTLRNQVQDHLLPILEKQEESRKRKQLQREKELLSLEKMAHAKRSSRIAGRKELLEMEERTREEERKRREEEAARKKEEQRQLKTERERDNRLMSRERRLKEREARRRLHEEELAQLSEDSKEASGASARMSERRRMAEIERNKKALQELEDEEDDWIFDCVCGVYGQIDDGTHSVACERCNTWQHSKCLDIDEEEADQEDFHFVCTSCRRREAEESDPHPRKIKIKVNRPLEPGSHPDEEVAEQKATDPRPPPTQLVVEFQSRPASSLPGGSEQSPPIPISGPSAVSSLQMATATPLQQIAGANFSASRSGFVQQSPASKGSNPFSSPHPNLPPPKQPSLNSCTQSLVPGNPAPLPAGDDDGNTQLFAQSGVSSGGRAVLAGSGSGGSSPSKEQRRAPSPAATTKTSPSATQIPNLNRLAPSLPAESTGSTTSSPSTALPHLTPAQSRNARSDHAAPGSSPLPPPSGGLSPTKHSPPVPKPQNLVNGGGANSAVTLPLVGGAAQTPVVFPPVAALAPSPQQQNLTPPVKPAEPARVVPVPQQLAQGSPTAQAVSAGSPRPDAPAS
ncbi:reticulocyte-binding protein 2 a [Staphylotrichum tortipilum]|uniref:Reticulocyte-binding protein 2 a n=1 Tax=Staphylotrichum tortipilum TaxID=2831512 RepID=A0AAN6RXM0_9PEZI|nr:reticulocyte-binding protein 2 a [Staphylotrichum longicolle]